MIEISEKEFYNMRKRAGVCPKCGELDAFTMAGRVLCADCAERAKVNMERMRNDPEKRSAMCKSVKKLKQSRKDAGLCPDCGGNPMQGHVKCVACVRRDRSYKRKYRGGTKPRGQYGICWTCNKKQVIPDKRLCQECYDKLIKNNFIRYGKSAQSSPYIQACS